MLIPREMIQTTTDKDGHPEVSCPILAPHLDLETRPNGSADLYGTFVKAGGPTPTARTHGTIGTLGVTPVRAHDRRVFVVNDFELGVLYAGSMMDLDTEAYARRDKVVGSFAGLPVELA